MTEGEGLVSGDVDLTAGEARTDAAGRFTLHGLRAGQRYRLGTTTDDWSVASDDRRVTASAEPIEIALRTAAPVTLSITGLRGFPLLIERALRQQPALAPVTGIVDGVGLTIHMEWLDPDSGAWLPVLSARSVNVKEDSPAELRFEQVPVGTIRVSTSAMLNTVPETFDPVAVQAGRRLVIPIALTPVAEAGQ